MGFLPVNDSITHKGEGYVNYTIKPASHTQTGDSVYAVANIVFDINAPIATPIIFNTIDAENPVSHVLPLPVTSDTNALLIKWSGEDEFGGSGIRFYDLFVSENGAPLPDISGWNYRYFHYIYWQLW
ncbi:MAG: hypothetical protein IPL42_09660 [Saprospiraceae bacterium]|nr:hypothetical protein [Saprospiraceae bacterium]